MNLLNLIEELGLEPKKHSASQGGEYHCPCPHCGGDDRFMLWLGKNRYWCRQCDAKGDAIQFCRDFQGLSFFEARNKVHRESHQFNPKLKKTPSTKLSDSLPEIWQSKAKLFSITSHQRLLIDPTAIELIQKRGLSLDTIKTYQLGWNPMKSFQRRGEWGLEETEKQKWICLPTGIVIPSFNNDMIQKVKIRKSQWKEGDLYGKYYEIPSTTNVFSIFEKGASEIAILVESEFDAMLIMQEAKDLCSCLALGGAQKRPAPPLQSRLKNKRLILFALDFDEAGKKEYIYWEKHYPNLRPWPIPDEKSPGDYHVNGGSIREWIQIGIKTYLNK